MRHKIPHHGSITGYHADAWSRLVQKDGWAVVTPYNRQREPVTTSSDCERILRMTDQSFITSPPGWSKFRHPNQAVQKTAEAATLLIGPEQGRHGQIRLRRSIGQVMDGTLNSSVRRCRFLGYESRPR